MSRHRGDDGATAVEFALVLPVLVALFALVLTFGLRTVYAGLAAHASRVGLRTATLHGPGGYPDDATTAARVIGLYPADLVPAPVVLVGPGPVRPQEQGSPLSVTVTYTVPVVAQAASLLSVAGLGQALAQLAVITETATGRLE